MKSTQYQVHDTNNSIIHLKEKIVNHKIRPGRSIRQVTIVAILAGQSASLWRNASQNLFEIL